MPGGRPSDIDTILRSREVRDPDTGEVRVVDVTVSSHIVDALRLGMYLQDAVAATGLAVETVNGWRRIAGKILLAHAGREIDHTKLTAHERRCLEFSAAVDEAEHSYQLRALADHVRLERGGIPQVTIREKVNGQGVVIERTTITEHTLPDARAIEWRLTRRFPERYSQHVVLSGELGGLSDTDRAAGLAEAVGAYLAGRDDEASQTTRSTPARARRAKRAAPSGEA